MTKTADQKSGDVPEWGPAMAGLSEKRRALVLALFDEDTPDKGDGLLPFAAKRAGYGTETSSSKSLGVIAMRILADDRVKLAVQEYAVQAVRSGLAPEVVRSIRNLVRDPKAKDHARILAMIYGRLDPEESIHKVKIEDTRPPTIEATQAVLDRIEALMQRAGLLPKSAPVIDGECRDVTGQRQHERST